MEWLRLDCFWHFYMVYIHIYIHVYSLVLKEKTCKLTFVSSHSSSCHSVSF